MNEVYEFLKKASVYFLATIENDQPRVRPFGTVNIFDNKLYIQTGKSKRCFNQMNGKKVELCAMLGKKWLRLSGTLVEDDRIEAQESLLNNYPSLKKSYRAGDGNNVVLYYKDCEAIFSSFVEESKVIKF